MTRAVKSFEEQNSQLNIFVSSGNNSFITFKTVTFVIFTSPPVLIYDMSDRSGNRAVNEKAKVPFIQVRNLSFSSSTLT